MRISTELGNDLETLFGGRLSDAELLARFVQREDVVSSEAAFAALVERHGPMVLGGLSPNAASSPHCGGRVPGGVPGARSQGPAGPSGRFARAVAARGQRPRVPAGKFLP